MKWRDILIGAFASLLVTIIGGVIVFYATKEPDQNKTEKLSYLIDQTAQFTGGSHNVAFSSLTLTNLGDVAAKNVTVSISFATATLKDLAVNASLGMKELSRERTSNSLRIVYDNLLPHDKVTINLLLSSAEKPTVSVRSNATLGEERTQLDSGKKSANSELNRLVGVAIPVTGILTILLTAILLFFLRSRGAFDFRSRNDTGFLLLHNGLIDEAESTLSLAVSEGQCDVYTLSNLAVCKATRGHFDKAQGLLKAAKFRERSGHGNAVILFNEGLVQLLHGDKSAAIKSLKEAISIAPRSIKNYYRKSVFFDKVRTEPGFNDLIKDV